MANYVVDILLIASHIKITFGYSNLNVYSIIIHTSNNDSVFPDCMSHCESNHYLTITSVAVGHLTCLKLEVFMKMYKKCAALCYLLKPLTFSVIIGFVLS